MANKIQLKRGLKANLPTLDLGEPAIVTNSGAEEMWIGANGNKEIPVLGTNNYPSATELKYVKGVTSDIQTQFNGKAPTSHTHPYLPLAGGTMTGALYPQQNTSYTVGQSRRIILSTVDPSGGGNGDIWIKYIP